MLTTLLNQRIFYLKIGLLIFPTTISYKFIDINKFVIEFVIRILSII